MELADVEVMKPPTAAIRIDPPIEAAMKELVDNYIVLWGREQCGVKPQKT